VRELRQPDDPAEWLNRAKSSLALARHQAPDIDYEDLCFQAQQAAEKAIKAIFISKSVIFPYTHDISHLLTILEKNGMKIPATIKIASKLTLYAAQTRYPGPELPVSEAEYDEALQLAGRVVIWAEKNMRT
jgi:HEPN domain-containing protein